MAVKQLTIPDLQVKLRELAPLVLLDVREVHEFEFAHIPKSVLIPLRELPQRVHELNPESEIAVICHHGIRSQQAAEYLASVGFQKVWNVKGGIDAWSLIGDTSVPRY